MPTAATGGWTEEGDLRFEVIFLETPHRLVRHLLAGRPHLRGAVGNAPPLGDTPLRLLRSPAPS